MILATKSESESSVWAMSAAGGAPAPEEWESNHPARDSGKVLVELAVIHPTLSWDHPDCRLCERVWIGTENLIVHNRKICVLYNRKIYELGVEELVDFTGGYLSASRILSEAERGEDGPQAQVGIV